MPRVSRRQRHVQRDDVRACAAAFSRSTSLASNESARACEMYGSYVCTVMPKARARIAMLPPMRPRPTMPSVLPRDFVADQLERPSGPRAGLCRRRECGARARASARRSVRPPTSVFAAGVLSTTTPARSRPATSIESTPTPARATTCSFGPAASRSRSTRVSERTIRPSASASAAAVRRASRRPPIDLDAARAQHVQPGL